MTIDAIIQRLGDVEASVKDLATEKECEGRHRRVGATLGDHKFQLEKLKGEIDRIGAEQRATANDLTLLRQTPLDATKLVLSTKSVIGLVVAIVAIVASYWNLSVKMDNQQRSTDAAAKIEEVRMKALSDAVADAKATAAQAKSQYELMRYDFAPLLEQVKEQQRKGKPK